MSTPFTLGVDTFHSVGVDTFHSEGVDTKHSVGVDTFHSVGHYINPEDSYPAIIRSPTSNGRRRDRESQPRREEKMEKKPRETVVDWRGLLPYEKSMTCPYNPSHQVS